MDKLIALRDRRDTARTASLTAGKVEDETKMTTAELAAADLARRVADLEYKDTQATYEAALDNEAKALFLKRKREAK
jgi:hypothetical protein